MSHANHLATPIMDAVRNLTHVQTLVPALAMITRDNADVLDSLETIRVLVAQYESFLPVPGRAHDLELGKTAAQSLLQEIEALVPVSSLADDLAVDWAIRDVLEL